MGLKTKNKQDYPHASDALHYAGILSYIAGIFLIMAFAGPYWIQSHPDSGSPMMNMGLWEYCFKDLRDDFSLFPKYIYGCHYVFSDSLYTVRDKVLPGWLMYVQSLVTMAVIFSFSGQTFNAITLMRWPLKFVLTYEWRLTILCFVNNAMACACLFLSLCIFGGQLCWRREWLSYPNYNYLSWSYGLAVVSFFFHGFAAYVLYFESRKKRSEQQLHQKLVAQMYVESSQNGFV